MQCETTITWWTKKGKMNVKSMWKQWPWKALILKEIEILKIGWINTNGKNVLHFIFLIHASSLKGFISLSMRYASQAFRTLSLVDLMSLSGISVCNVDR